MSLRDYTRKRQFERTPEPDAEQVIANARPIFVVQLHHARARHYDFRLEADGVLKSWAVPKGPSLRPGEKRLAVEVEDHPLAYATFEGDIPEGNYGAGHVDVFDHGHWAADGDPLEGIAAGKLDFTLSGGKLNGGWKLVRTARSGRQRQWLLMKRSDEFASDLEADDLIDAAPAPRATAKKATAKKTATKKARGTASTPAPAARTADGKTTGSKASNAATAAPARAPRARAKADAAWAKRALALPGAVDRPYPPDFAPQLASSRAAAPPGQDWLHEIKWDGYRMLVDLLDGKAKLRSRGGLDWTGTFAEITAAVERLPVRDARLDGELVVIDAQGRSDFSALQQAIEGSSRQPLRYLVFDLPGVAGVDVSGVSQIERKALLKRLLGDEPGVIAFSDHVVGHGPEVFKASGDKDMEGIISKRVDAPYAGARSQAWVKVKHENTDEFVIVGYTDPKGGRAGFGSLLLARQQDGGLEYVGRVGTGFDNERIRALMAKFSPLATGEATVEIPDHVPLPRRSVHWMRPQLVAEVAFRGWAKEGLLRQSSFKRLREDKTMADLQPEAGGDDVAITHPQRVVYAKGKVTKSDVADYYRKIARWLLPELRRRPVSVVRCPDGTKGECFFQKHYAASLGKRVGAVPLKQKSGKEDYLYVEDLQGVLELVQMNTLEFHPWGSSIDAPEQPDRLVFDLDPGEGVPWAKVKDAAREIRAKLRQAGLESFVRLSGGKGLHVVVPIRRGPSWDQVKNFCGAFAEALAEHAPDRYVANMSKAKRPGKIFVDWLRNGRGATSVCSWSLRARDTATVAVPLRWEDLGGVRSPGEYTLERALQRASRLRKDPWDGIANLDQALPGT
jgi:bifunctional non-homologous end joining protein LigD